MSGAGEVGRGDTSLCSEIRHGPALRIEQHGVEAMGIGEKAQEAAVWFASPAIAGTLDQKPHLHAGPLQPRRHRQNDGALCLDHRQLVPDAQPARVVIDGRWDCQRPDGDLDSVTVQFDLCQQFLEEAAPLGHRHGRPPRRQGSGPCDDGPTLWKVIGDGAGHLEHRLPITEESDEALLDDGFNVGRRCGATLKVRGQRQSG